MKYRRIGSSGLSVSEISYGSWLTHGCRLDEEESTACIRTALEVGINFFDTADINADSQAETILGRALAGTDRDGVVIASKVYYPRPPYGPNNYGLGRKHIMASVHGSLKRLGTDYLDLYLAQRFDRHTPLEETFLTFSDLVRQGKVLYVGVCEWTADQITRGAALARELRVPFIANSPQYSMLWRVIEAQVVAVCEREHLSQLAFAPLCQGILTGKYLPGQPAPAGSRAADPHGGAASIAPHLSQDVLERVQSLGVLADAAGLTLPQLALAWVLQNPGVASAVVGASRPEQLRENAAASGVTLELELLMQIDEILGRAVQSDPTLILSP